MMAQLTRNRAPGGGPGAGTAAGSSARIRIKSAPKRTSKALPVLAALLLMGLGGLAAAWASSRGDVPTPVVMVVRDIKRGETLSAGDLGKVNLRFDQSIAAVPWDRLDDVVGRQLVLDAATGTLLTKGMLTEVTQLPAGTVVVGAVLEPGALPVGGLRNGDRVIVMLSPETKNGGQEPAVLVADAEVWQVAPVVDTGGGTVTGVATGQRWVSLLVPEDSAPVVGAAAQQGQLRLAARGAKAG